MWSSQFVYALSEYRCKFLGALLLLDDRKYRKLRLPTCEELVGIELLERDDEIPEGVRDVWAR